MSISKTSLISCSHLHGGDRGYTDQPRVAEIHSLQTHARLELSLLAARTWAPEQNVSIKYGGTYLLLQYCLAS